MNISEITLEDISKDPIPPKKPPFLEQLKLLVLGQPIASEKCEDTLVSKLIALPIFCSDAISSVAYGTQQILLALCAGGFWLGQYAPIYSSCTLGISTAIVILLVIVAASYRQTIRAYPNGGGSYTVSRDNLGITPGLIAGASLMVDYVLTLSVSVTSGLQNIESVPLLAPLKVAHHLVEYSLLIIFVMTVLNLRGLRETGTLFAIPTYGFVVMCYLMLFLGIFGPFFGWHYSLEYANQIVPSGNPMVSISRIAILVIVLRAFANGCSAMTGVEALSNGTPCFYEPKAKNASITLVWMALILGTIFYGVSWLAIKFHIVYWEFNGLTSPAVIDQLSGTIFGKEGPWSLAYITTQVVTALVLIVAAQTSFAGFPRLSSILAKDGFLPRQLMHVGDKLAFNNGIILLSLFSSFFVILEKGSVDKLIPYFAIGVFMAFTMSQSGMVMHWIRKKGSNWILRASINGIGAMACLIVVIDIAMEKFTQGAWAVFLIIGSLLFVFRKISRHYAEIAIELSPERYLIDGDHEPMKNTVLVLVNGVHAGTLYALEYARSISSDCIALSVETEPEHTALLKEQWKEYVPDVPLIIIKSPFRSLIVPITKYLDYAHEELPNRRITIIVGEFVPCKWWESLLHGNTGLILKFALLNRRDVVVTNVRFWVDNSQRCEHP